MKKNYISIFLLLISINCFAQNKPVKVLLGKTETEVVDYFTTLNEESSNASLKIERGANNYGDLMLTIGFALDDESKSKCLTITTVFHHMRNGSEVCHTQMIEGRDEYARENLSYLKDNFKQISSNNWEEINIKGSVKITVELSKIRNSYAIYYRLEPIKNE